MKVTQLKKGVTWTIQILLAMVFLTVGMAKISGVESTINLFQKIGLGQWLRYVAGFVEVTSAILLLFGPYASLGAVMIVCSMVGAVMVHVWLIGGSVLPALALGATALLVLYMRRQVRQAEELQEFREESHRKSA